MTNWKIWVPIIVVILIILWVAGIYNGLVGLDQNVKNSWAQVETQYQRRFDLIPNLVETVKGYAAHEKEVFKAVSDARARLAGAATLKDKVEATNALEGAIGRLLAIAEAYPALRASENFVRLQDELAGTENRIAVARMHYNEAVQEYNTAAKRVPTVFFVNFFGFEHEKIFFEAPKAAREAPKIKF